MQSLLELTLQTERKVQDITAEPLVRERLLEMGVSPGRLVRVLQRLPFNGPIIVQAGVLFLALRHEEAAAVWVE